MWKLTRLGFAVFSLVGLSWSSNFLVNPAHTEETSEQFWTEAKQIITNQVDLAEPLELASRTQDAAEIRHSRNKLILHLGQVDRFIRRYPMAGTCPISQDDGKLGFAPLSSHAFATLSSGKADALTTYCSLKQTREQLLAILQVLAVRSQVLQTSGTVLDRVPLVNGKDKPFDPFQYWHWQVGDRSYEPYFAKLRDQSRPSLEVADISTVFSATKTAIANYQPHPLAIFPSSDDDNFLGQNAVTALRSPFKTQMYVAQNGMQVYEEILDYKKYQDFFASTPRTGFVRLVPNGIDPTKFSLTPSPASTKVATLSNPYLTDPRSLLNYGQALLIKKQGKNDPEPEIRESILMLAFDQGQMIVQGKDLDYGFMQNIGDIPLDQITADLQSVPENVSANLWQYFLKYQPPTRVEALQSEQRLYATEKLEIDNIPIVSQLPIQLDRTYLMRTFAYNLPETVKSPRAIVRRDFPFVEVRDSSDVLIAFRPIRQRDGNYTLLWRMLKRFPSPKITDLINYVKIR